MAVVYANEFRNLKHPAIFSGILPDPLLAFLLNVYCYFDIALISSFRLYMSTCGGKFEVKL